MQAYKSIFAEKKKGAKEDSEEKKDKSLKKKKSKKKKLKENVDLHNLDSHLDTIIGYAEEAKAADSIDAKLTLVQELIEEVEEVAAMIEEETGDEDEE